MIRSPKIVAEVPEHERNPQCPTCRVVQQLSWINDGECDQALNNLECCYDGGDCYES